MIFGGRTPKRADEHPGAEYTNLRSRLGERRERHPYMKVVVYGLVVLFAAMGIYAVILATVYDVEDPVGINLYQFEKTPGREQE